MTTYRVIEAYPSPYPESLFFRRGATVDVGRAFTGDPDWEHWRWCTGPDGVQAWVPENYLEVRGATGVLTRDYDARELSVAVGETVVISEIVNGFGMAEKADGQRGWVPMRNLVGQSPRRPER